jgi:hypothetical protein
MEGHRGHGAAVITGLPQPLSSDEGMHRDIAVRSVHGNAANFGMEGDGREAPGHGISGPRR